MKVIDPLYEQINEKPIGTGGYGNVYLARQKQTGQYVVVKMANINPKTLAAMRSEIEMLASLRHPNIIRFIGKIDRDNSVGLIMEYADGLDLRRFLSASPVYSPLPEAEVLRIFTQIMMGVAYIHSKNIIHRDLKPANIFLFRSGVVKLGDFGISRILENDAMAKTRIFTPNYAAPEMLKSGSTYRFKVDIWAAGCVLYELMIGKRMIDARGREDALSQIEQLRPQIPAQYSAALGELFQKLICIDPDARPNAADVLAYPIIASQMPALEELFKQDSRLPFAEPPVPMSKDQRAAFDKAAAERAVQDKREAAEELASTFHRIPAIDLGSVRQTPTDRRATIVGSITRIFGKQASERALKAVRERTAAGQSPELVRACEAILMLDRVLSVENARR